MLRLRWVIILWLLISSAFAFISATVIRPYPSWAFIYLERPRAEGFREIAPFLARDLSWGVSLFDSGLRNLAVEPLGGMGCAGLFPLEFYE